MGNPFLGFPLFHGRWDWRVVCCRSRAWHAEHRPQRNCVSSPFQPPKWSPFSRRQPTPQRQGPGDGKLATPIIATFGREKHVESNKSLRDLIFGLLIKLTSPGSDCHPKQVTAASGSTAEVGDRWALQTLRDCFGDDTSSGSWAVRRHVAGKPKVWSGCRADPGGAPARDEGGPQQRSVKRLNVWNASIETAI